MVIVKHPQQSGCFSLYKGVAEVSRFKEVIDTE